jgi:medium-chain acyl-[acyl-carrier-protein] hydrolase
MSKINLFCISYAGSSALTYLKWKQYLEPEIELYPLELAGRGNRTRDGFYKDFNAALDDLYHLVKKRIDDTPYAFYGHSMGAILAYEMVCRLRREGHRELVHLFISGRKAPHYPTTDNYTYNLPDNEFQKAIMNLGGTDRAVFSNPELLEIFLPVLRADYKILATYQYQELSIPLDCNITVFNGDDDLTNDEIQQWKPYTKGKFGVYTFSGGHFFIHKKFRDIVAIINSQLKIF